MVFWKVVFPQKEEIFDLGKMIMNDIFLHKLKTLILPLDVTILVIDSGCRLRICERVLGKSVNMPNYCIH